MSSRKRLGHFPGVGIGNDVEICRLWVTELRFERVLDRVVQLHVLVSERLRSLPEQIGMSDRGSVCVQLVSAFAGREVLHRLLAHPEGRLTPIRILVVECPEKTHGLAGESAET